MMRITFTIDLGNDAARTPNDVREILQRWWLAYAGQGSGGQLPFDQRDVGIEPPLRDVNGNTVGYWTVTP
jgi:hypothetical protein